MATSVLTAQNGKVWLITGASAGFGRLLAEYLCTLGAMVIATARDVNKLADFKRKYPNALVLTLDVTKPDSIQGAVRDALAYAGRVDVLVNNAWYGVTGAIEEVTEAEYLPMFQTNLFGLIQLTQALLPQFRERRSGNIVNLSSIGGLIGLPGWGFYNATKFAVEGFSEALAGELEPLGVQVTVVEPGAFRTDFLGRSGVEAKRVIADYGDTAGKAREYFQTQAGKQAGDPQRAVEAIVAAVSAEHPPRHLLLGKAALKRFRARLEQWNKDLEAWEETTSGAVIPRDIEGRIRKIGAVVTRYNTESWMALKQLKRMVGGES
jgi:NAD(P)-dependent dehydrogenase (short-subunit alcohol dehydrogenase family)